MTTNEGMENNVSQNQNVWTWDMRCRVSSPARVREMYRLDGSNMYPERFFSSAFEDPVTGKKFDVTHSNINQSSHLPAWLGSLIKATLGISPSKKKASMIISTILHMLTMVSGFCYGACGLFFNVYDTMSTLTRTSVLFSVANCIIGAYWILLGIYSHSLAAQLFGNNRMVECIRLHSKTFMKINMIFIVAILATAMIVVNIYTQTELLDSHALNGTKEVYHSSCATIGVSVVLCQIYVVSKVVYSFLSLCWNLMVAAICLSVCRTLTIGIRRFMRELSFDSKIYEEYLYQAGLFQPKSSSAYKEPDFESSWCIWDDDINTFEDDSDIHLPSSRENLLRSIRIMRQNNPNQEYDLEASVNTVGSHVREDTAEELIEYAERNVLHIQDVLNRQDSTSSAEMPNVKCDEGRKRQDSDFEHSQADTEPRQKPRSQSMEIPIMSNQDLMFTYFKLMRRLSSTSRLLQRWMSSWITFVILWCSMLIIYWTSHSASLTDITQFMLPIVALGLMTSAYAEVNFEGERLLKCIVPTEERMSVIFYFQNARLELKIFSFVMTYTVLMTAWAGVALTVASRIIMDQFS